MPQDPSLNTSGYPPPMTAWYTALCPCCKLDAEWKVTTTSTSDLVRTTVTYDIACPSEAA